MKRRLFKFEKISWKLTLLYSLLFSGVLLLLSAGVLYGIRYFMFEQAYTLVRTSSEETISDILDTGGAATLSDSELLGEAQTDSDINITIADAQGNIVNRSLNFNITSNDVTARPGVIRRIENDGMRLMVYNSRVMSGNELVAYLQVAYNLEKDYGFIKLLFFLLAGSDALGIVLSVFVGYIVGRRMLRPIDRITKTAQSISINELEGRIPLGKADDELAHLASTLNSMLDRLKDSIDRQSRFVSDASHELRTPISVILGYIGLIDRWGKDDRKVLQESVDAIKGEADSMHELIEKLLFLARNDSGKIAATKEPTNLQQLFEDIAEESKMIAPDRNFPIRLYSSMTLNADRKMLKQMLRNLIDNGIKFTKPGGIISLTAMNAGGNIRIVVEDDGTGIPPEEIGRIFDRFYRVDKARAKENGGSGLGLAIVKSIVDAHGGDINIDSEPGKGTRISILLPRE
jgi:two-component system sensor histidine kinase ArlS